MNGPHVLRRSRLPLPGMVLSMSGCDQLKARDQLNKGVEAYKSAHYEEAIGHFQNATQLTQLPMAKTYLASVGAECGPGIEHRGEPEDQPNSPLTSSKRFLPKTQPMSTA